MSDPCLVQISFTIKHDMPSDMKTLLLCAFSNYYTTWFPKDKPSEPEIQRLCKKYPEIEELWRNDAYHNVGLQKCQIDDWDINRPNMPKYPENNTIGLCITCLPRYTTSLENFLKLVGPHIESKVSSIGFQHFKDFGDEAGYYYFDNSGNIRRKLLKPSKEDEIIFDKHNKKK